MAQTNYTPISLYYSTTASAVPTAANLVPGELAINTNDGKLYYEDSAGVVQVLASKATSSGTFGAISATSITNSGLTTGRVVYTTTGGLETSSANLLYSGTDLTVYGLTVGRGNGAVATNTVVGYQALASTSAGLNTAVGYQAGLSNTTGTELNALGYQAGYSNTAGSQNIAIGNEALYSNQTGSSNTAIGRQSLRANTADSNTGVGFRSLYLNTSGTANVAVGQQALNSNTTASNNTAVGYQAGYANITGASNTAIGYFALGSNVSGNYNVSIGQNSGQLATGTGNVFCGYASGANTTSTYNTFAGYGAGNGITTGGKNTILGGYTGNQGGLDIRTASNYIVLSDGDGNPRGYFDGLTFYSPTTYTYTTGGSANVRITSSTGDFALSTSSLRYKKNIEDAPYGLTDVMALRPVVYQSKSKIDGDKVFGGFIAEEVHEAGLTQFVDYDDENRPNSLQYGNMVSLCIKAIQELKAEFDAYKATHP
jgi:hypothetical protein